MPDIHIRNEATELRLLFEVSQVLDGAAELSGHLEEALALMARYTAMMRGSLTLMDPQRTGIVAQAVYGPDAGKCAPFHYTPGAGLVGSVIHSCGVMLLAQDSETPFPLGRTNPRDVQKEDLAFVSVPILMQETAVGALTADKLFADSVSLEEDLRLLRVLASLISRAVRIRRDFHSVHAAVVEENRRLQRMLQSRFETGSLIGTSATMQHLIREIVQVSRTNATVLLRGESGTGKELIAGLIHANSPRAGHPLIKVNCAALPENLIESELFGHERGAFTGAVGTKKGRFEMAHGGTLFLDEVGELSALAQAKLLRALQEKEFERVGGTRTLRVDVRLIAATNRNLETMAAEGAFRQDLYYRLNVFPLLLPPLRERKDDILPLASHFINAFGKEVGRRNIALTPAAADLLREYAWPGNIRELENAMERAVILCGPEGSIDPSHLPIWLRQHDAGAENTPEPSSALPLNEALAGLEKRLIREALEKNQGNMAKAAQSLGITERIMGLRMKSYGLAYKKFRPQSG